MTQTFYPNRPKDDARDARLKAALKANIAKRKAQARARAETGENENNKMAAKAASEEE